MADPAASSARGDILARIRAALPDDRPLSLDAAVPNAAGAEAGTTGAARVARFSEQLAGVGGHVHVVRSEDAAADALAELVSELDAREVALSDDALVRRLAARLPDEVHTFDGWSERERLFACDLGITSAQAAIAETGTLVLESSAERSRLVSLVPPVHLAVLRASAILPGLGQALVARGRSADAARAVTLITGPSRTADIELELVVGVHGPRALHVVVLEEPNA